MSQRLYENWKTELEGMYKEHPKLLKYNTKAGIGLSGNIQITISELEDNISDLEKKIKKYEEQQKGEDFAKALELSESQTQEVQDFYKAADKHGLDEQKVKQLLAVLDKNVSEIQTQLPSTVQKHIEEVKKLQTSMGFEGKFKTSIPIIPFILSYDIEGKTNLKDFFKQMWQDMKNGDVFLYKK